MGNCVIFLHRLPEFFFSEYPTVNHIFPTASKTLNRIKIVRIVLFITCIIVECHAAHLFYNRVVAIFLRQQFKLFHFLQIEYNH